MSIRLAAGLLILLAVGWAASRSLARIARSEDMEALINATREPVPDYFPHEWTEEYKP